MKRLILSAACLLFAALPSAPAPAADRPAAKPPMRTYDTPYYTLTTDLPESAAREADLRMTRMFEEYKRRTAGFSGDPRGKFLFTMYQNPDDYYAAGAIPKSSGEFSPMTGRLMAIAGEKPTAQTWHIVQHEGFHQFAFSTINARMPTWLNEGLAEYFGEAIFTGDSFVSGIIPPGRLKLVKQAIQDKSGERKWLSFAAMMAMTPEQWTGDMQYAHYTQAWAMVHFLAQGEDGKYQKAFVQYMNLMNRGAAPADAWANIFGNDTAAFQAKCDKWWLALPDDPSHTSYQRAIVLGMTSILAREESLKQQFPDFAAFLANARPTDIKLSRDLWLPDSLVQAVTAAAPHLGAWTLEKPKNQNARLLCTTTDGETFTGTFVLNGRRVVQVNVPPPTSASQPAAPGR